MVVTDDRGHGPLPSVAIHPFAGDIGPLVVDTRDG
jgi:hypothetical protein